MMTSTGDGIVFEPSLTNNGQHIHYVGGIDPINPISPYEPNIQRINPSQVPHTPYEPIHTSNVVQRGSIEYYRLMSMHPAVINDKEKHEIYMRILTTLEEGMGALDNLIQPGCNTTKLKGKKINIKFKEE